MVWLNKLESLSLLWLIFFKINCFELFVVLQVFEELGLIKFNGLEFKFKELEGNKPRISLETSKLLKNVLVELFNFSGLGVEFG